MTRWTLATFVLGWLLACSGTSDLSTEAPEPPAPAEPVPQPDPPAAADSRLDDIRTLYDRYQVDDAPTRDELPFSKGLQKAWMATQDDVDFDPVIDGQDFEISDIDVALDGDDVVVRFQNFGTPQQVRWVMVQEDGRWVADDVRTSRWSLAELTGK